MKMDRVEQILNHPYYKELVRINCERNRLSLMEYKYDGEILFGFVYLINAVGTTFYKIGMSNSDLKSRIGSMQCGCPFKMIVIKTIRINEKNTRSIERKIQNKFITHRVHGEWFDLRGERLESVIDVMDEFEEIDKEQIKNIGE